VGAADEEAELRAALDAVVARIEEFEGRYRELRRVTYSVAGEPAGAAPESPFRGLRAAVARVLAGEA
jgi:hypothetical protein